MTAEDRATLFADVKHAAGWRPTPRKEWSGEWVIGYGRAVRNLRISRGLAEAWLNDDLDNAETECRGTFGWFDALNSTRQAVVVELVCALTLPGLRRCDRLLTALATGAHEVAASEIERLRAREVDHRTLRLAHMMRAEDQR